MLARDKRSERKDQELRTNTETQEAMILGGPQKGRDRLWLGKEDNIDTGAAREELIMERATENQVYENEISHLNRENDALKDQLNRALKELKEYQIKYPSAYASFTDQDGTQVNYLKYGFSPISFHPIPYNIIYFPNLTSLSTLH